MRKIAIILCLIMVMTSAAFNVPVYAVAPPIAIMVESNGFDSTNVDGDDGTTLLWKKGDADTTGGVLRIAPSSGGKAGTVVRRNQIQLSDGFSTYFVMNLHNPGWDYADGLAFVIYEADTPQVGGYGGELGYGGITSSVAIEFDIWENGAGDKNDPNGDHVGIMLNGNADHGLAQVDQPTNSDTTIKNAETNVWIDYDIGDITVTYGPSTTRGDAANKSMTRTVGTFLEGKNVFVGFSASTGGAWADHDVLKWYFKSDYVAGGLDPTAGTYSQGAGTLGIDLAASVNPTGAAVVVKDAGGSPLNNATGTIYLDDESIGAFDTGGTGVYSYSIPALANGTHTLRAVAGGGASNFATFTVEKYELAYDGNGNTGGAVPTATTSYAVNTTVSALGNTGALEKTNYTFLGWNTNDEGTGTDYSEGDVITLTSNVTLYANWQAVNTTIDCSNGSTSYTIGNQNGQTIDSSLSLSSGLDLQGAKVYIAEGFDSAKDELTFGTTAAISGSYDAAKGMITYTGTASSEDYEAVLKTVKFKSTATDAGTRTIVFSLGDKLSFGGHYYEYVSSGAITWTAAKAAAEARTFFGQTGYLATISSAEENDFLTQKLGADAWIGASDATTEGAWYWVAGPEANTQFSSGAGVSVEAVGGLYNNWNAGEPNNAGAEDYAEIYCSGANPGKWNDLANAGEVTGYLTEYTSAVGASDSKTISLVEASSGGGDGGSTPAAGVKVIVNGEVQNAGTQTESTQDGVVTVTVDVDEQTISAKMKAVLEAQGNASDTENVVEVPVISDADNAEVALSGEIIREMEENDFTLKVTFDKVSYLIPSSEINIGKLAQELDTVSDVGKIEIKVEVQGADEDTIAQFELQAQKSDYEIIFPPVTFEVTAVNTTTNEKTVITHFTNYVTRIFEIPQGIDPSKITTGIVANADGTFSHIPTEIVKIGDKYYAKLNSLTNSTYSVIWNPVVFTDLNGHWAKGAADNMGSRLVVNGVGGGKFDPERAITRGEFAAIITKALGIYRTKVGSDRYLDVSKDNIFYDAISIADECNLIKGYTNGCFESEKSITREEAMLILSRAAKIANLETATGLTVQDFSDSGQVSSWAFEDVAYNIEKGIIIGSDGAIKPQDTISRAEVVTAVERILMNTELINR